MKNKFLPKGTHVYVIIPATNDDYYYLAKGIIKDINIANTMENYIIKIYKFYDGFNHLNYMLRLSTFRLFNPKTKHHVKHYYRNINLPYSIKTAAEIENIYSKYLFEIYFSFVFTSLTEAMEHYNLLIDYILHENMRKFINLSTLRHYSGTFKKSHYTDVVRGFYKYFSSTHTKEEVDNIFKDVGYKKKLNIFKNYRDISGSSNNL